jgi:dipeptidyl aminopeptidase/acylaminoacyl peptidase
MLSFLLIQLNLHAQDSIAVDLNDMVQVKNVSAPVLSADGQHVAYNVSWGIVSEKESEYRSHIWVADTDGNWNRQFTRGDESAGSPAFTPDGKYLSFTSGREGSSQLYRLPLLGGEAEQLTDIESGVRSYKWSPDGSKVAFISTEPESKESKEKKEQKEDVTVVGEDHRFSRIYVQEIGDNPMESKPITLFSEDLHAQDFSWSPDGNTIVFSHRTSPLLDDRDESAISTVPADSGEVSLLIDMGGADYAPVFTHDGSHIAFLSSGNDPEPIGLTDAYIISAEGDGDPVALAHTFDRNINDLMLGDKEGAVYVTEGRKTLSTMYELPLNGDNPIQLTPNDAYYSFNSAPMAGVTAYTKQKSDMFEEVYATSGSIADATQLSDFSSDYIFPEIPRVETITWTSYDGMEIEGLLIYPIDYKEGEEYPLFLNVHGGPGGVYSNTFLGSGAFYNAAFFAHHGYAVLKPNPRGSSGYGKEFRYANFQDLGEGDYEDIMSGVDEVIEMGIADPDQLVMAGWSYGGYMAARIATKTDRFKAISMGAGLFNLESMFVTTDVIDYGLGLMGGGYWESDELKEVYKKLSPHTMVDEVTTPVQLLHSSNDQRVPASQSFEMYQVLKRMDVPTELVLYPRSGHGPSEPKLSVDVGMRVLDWFDTYLDRADM